MGHPVPFFVFSMNEKVKICIEQAQRFLALREHNKSELIAKLRNKGFDIVIINHAIDYLVNADELSEERYIRSFIRTNNKRHPESKSIVFHRLLQKGAEKNLVKIILDEIYTPDYEQNLLQLASENVLKKSKNKSEEQVLYKIVKSGFKLSESKKMLNKIIDKVPKTE